MKDGHFLAKEKLPEHNLAHDVKRRDYRCGKGVVERLDEPHKTEIQSKIRSLKTCDRPPSVAEDPLLGDLQYKVQALVLKNHLKILDLSKEIVRHQECSGCVCLK